jgi:fructose 1,6-bisphosphatase
MHQEHEIKIAKVLKHKAIILKNAKKLYSVMTRVTGGKIMILKSVY